MRCSVAVYPCISILHLIAFMLSHYKITSDFNRVSPAVGRNSTACTFYVTLNYYTPLYVMICAVISELSSPVITVAFQTRYEL